MVDMFATKLNHKLPIYVSPVPDANAMNIDALNISWEGLDGYAFYPVALIPKVIQNALVLGSSQSVNQAPITTASLASSAKTTFQSEVPSESHVSESSCLAPGHHSESLASFSEEVADRIKAPQRPSSMRLYESRWAIFELWCQQNKVVSAEPSISDIAEFFNHLFTVKI